MKWQIISIKSISISVLDWLKCFWDHLNSVLKLLNYNLLWKKNWNNLTPSPYTDAAFYLTPKQSCNIICIHLIIPSLSLSLKCSIKFETLKSFQSSYSYSLRSTNLGDWPIEETKLPRVMVIWTWHDGASHTDVSHADWNINMQSS